MPDLKPFIVSGIALGGVFSLSGVGMTVLYQATGVLNLAYGAIGATGALVGWELMGNGMSNWLAYAIAIGSPPPSRRSTASFSARCSRAATRS